MSKWLMKYPYKSRVVLFGVLLCVGLWLFPQESLIENGVLHHLKLLVSHGCAAAAGYQITYMFYLWRDDRKERKRVERLDKLK